MTSRNLKNNLLLLAPLVLAAWASGCGGGGGGGALNSPGVGQTSNTQRVQISGQVLIPQELAQPRAANALFPETEGERPEAAEKGVVSDQPVAGATVEIIPTGQTRATATAQCNSRGEFTLSLSSFQGGVLRARHGNRELESRLEASQTTTPQRQANITVESTVANKLKDLPAFTSKTLEELEGLARTGEAASTTAEILAAYQQNRAPVVNTTTTQEDAEFLEDVEIIVRRDCKDGRVWCVVMTPVRHHPTRPEKQVSKMLLLRMEEKSVAGSVGAGLVQVQWPSPLSPPSAITPSDTLVRQLGENPLLSHVNRQITGGQSAVGFVVRPNEGVTQKRTVLYEAVFAATTLASGQKVQPIVASQKLRGVYSEKRSPTRVAD